MQNKIFKAAKTIVAYIQKSGTITASVVFLAATLAITYPFIRSPHNTLTAPLASDTMSSVIQYDALDREHLNPFTADTFKTIAQPDGVPSNAGVNRVSFLSTLFLWGGTLLFGAITAHSLEAITGFFFTALVTFLFIRKVTSSNAIGLISGLVYGFWPQMLTLGRAAPTYTHMWLFILPLWAFWSLATKGIERRRVVLAALSIMPAIFWTPYYAFHIFLVGITCLTIAFIYLYKLAKLRPLVLSFGLIFGTWVVAYCLYYLIGTTASADDIPTRTIDEAYQQSASPLMYLLPGEYSWWGKALYESLITAIPRATQTSLYIGMGTALLCLTAAVALVKRIDIGHLHPSKEAKLTICMGLSVVLVCFAFSLPPTLTLFGANIPTPNHLVVSYVPALRAGQRLVMPLMAGALLTASMCMFLIVKKYHGIARYIVLAVLGLILAVDLWSPAPNSATQVKSSPAILSLKEMPDGRVAQYQEGSLVGYPAQTFCLMEMYHQKPIVNDCGLGRSGIDPSTPSHELAKIVPLAICDQFQALKKIKTRYVIIPTRDKQVLACLGQQKTLLRDSNYKIYEL